MDSQTRYFDQSEVNSVAPSATLLKIDHDVMVEFWLDHDTVRV